jgi:CDP-diacylglycerol--glycerol-3-phosphate 3-phosphatidyltransferase
MKQKEPRHNFSYYAINAITLYRLVASAFLLYLILTDKIELFKWFLAFSFFTDAIDGFLARKFKVVSVLGSRLDSIADDFTILMAVIGLFVFRYEFLEKHAFFLFILLGLFVVQISYALIRYGKFSSFHTWSAKLAVMFQGSFLILAFFLPEPPEALFYAAVVVTAIDLIEEIILVFMLPKWQVDVKGIYWVLREKKN